MRDSPLTGPTSPLGDALGQLERLGSAERIAAYFVDHAITGVPNEPNTCPVAMWLRQTLRCEVSVSRTAAGTEDDCSLLPLAVSVFVAEFDDRAYPELIRFPFAP